MKPLIDHFDNISLNKINHSVLDGKYTVEKESCSNTKVYAYEC